MTVGGDQWALRGARAALGLDHSHLLSLILSLTRLGRGAAESQNANTSPNSTISSATLRKLCYTESRDLLNSRHCLASLHQVPLRHPEQMPIIVWTTLHKRSPSFKGSGPVPGLLGALHQLKQLYPRLRPRCAFQRYPPSRESGHVTLASSIGETRHGGSSTGCRSLSPQPRPSHFNPPFSNLTTIPPQTSVYTLSRRNVPILQPRTRLALFEDPQESAEGHHEGYEEGGQTTQEGDGRVALHGEGGGAR